MAGKPPASDYPARWWAMLPDGRMECRLCPRFCKLQEGQRGFCFVRQRAGRGMVLTTYGRSSGFCVDPIEKKPLNHFLPGTSVLSFGTAGCNLGCRFCQNWDISKARKFDRLSDAASPDAIAATAKRLGCRSVAFTYNDPVIFAEYAIDVAQACREQGIKTVAVTAGYITGEARPEFYRAMDAANVDLKAFTEDFYHRLCYARLQPVLDTLLYLRRETDVWFEVTTLLIPGENDSREELDRASDWFAANLGPDVPWHFTAFHPDFKMLDTLPTPPPTLAQAREIARSKGLKHVYTGNVHDRAGGSTWCPSCGALLIERDWYELGAYHLDGNRCQACGSEIAGRFERQPGTWGARRLPVRLG
jgi:pyruvate formate lyase activating enzyme